MVDHKYVQFLNKRAGILFATVLLVGSNALCGIIPADRAIDWTQSGVPGGIPNRTTIYTNLNSNATVTQINDALKRCPAGQVVYLSAGTYVVSNTINIPNWKTLRGAGSNTLIYSISMSGWPVIAFPYAYAGNPSSYDIRTNTPLTKGTTSFMIASNPGCAFVAGDNAIIDQLNDSSSVYNVTPWGYENPSSPLLCYYCDRSGAPNYASRVQGQMVQITGFDGSNVTFSPGLYWDINPAFKPQLAFCGNPCNGSTNNQTVWAGIEDFTIQRATNAIFNDTISMENTSYCWVKNIHSINGGDKTHIRLFMAFRDEVRDCYFDRSAGLISGGGEAINLYYTTSGCLIENNICNLVRGFLFFSGSTSGNVIAYNYVGIAPNINQTFLCMSIGMHGAHAMFNLFEGNVLAKYEADAIHGSSSHNTLFRNWIKGRQDTYNNVTNTQAMYPISINISNHYFTIVGNVLGYPGVTNDVHGQSSYEIESPTPYVYGDSYTIYKWGYNQFWTFSPDPMCKKTAIVHGNYDYVTQSTVWSNGLSQILPASLYRTNKPGWWDSTPWPPIGPDVQGHHFPIPAETRFLNIPSAPVIPLKMPAAPTSLTNDIISPIP